MQKIRQNPKDVSFAELKQVLEDHGFQLDRVAGSHHVFQIDLGDEKLSVNIPYNRPIKVVYVKQALTEIAKAIALGIEDQHADGES